jgi:TolB protein
MPIIMIRRDRHTNAPLRAGMHAKGAVAMVAISLALAACSSAPARSSSLAFSASVAASASPSPSAPPAEGQIVFWNDAGQSGPRQIYIEHADGSNVRQLVTSTENDVLPSFSPDGKMVVFSRMDPSGRNTDGIFVVNIDGSGLHQLKPEGCPGRCGDAVEGHAWSRDGKQIVFTRVLFTGMPGTPLTPADAPYNVGLWVMKADGSGAHQVTLAGLSCVKGVCTGGIAGAPGAQDDEAGWSPDGKRLVFLRDTYTAPEQFAILTVATNGSDLQRVTPEGMNVGDPDWSPDGSLIAFQSPPEANQGGEQNIYTIHPDGTGLTQLTAHLSLQPDGSEGTIHPSWSPDGTQIVFSHNPGTNGGGGDLWIMNRDGSGLHLLTATPLNENGEFWGISPGQ